jgi:hypothetical protein
VRRGPLLLSVLLLLVATTAATLALRRTGAARGSSLSRGGAGWLAARRYLEARGARAVILDKALSGAGEDEPEPGRAAHGAGEQGRTADGAGEPGLAAHGADEQGRMAHGAGEPGLATHGAGDQGRKAHGAGPGAAATPGAAGRSAGAAGSGARAGRPGVLVVTFPWQQPGRGAFDEQLELYLRRGGDVVLAYSGEDSDLALRGLLDLEWRRVRTPPLDPWSWRAFAHREWDLRPAGFTAPPVRIWAPRVLPVPPAGAEALYLSPRGAPVVAAFRRWRGRVVLLPMDALTNARLGEHGNAALLETLFARLGPRWIFDEYHHGLVAAGAAAGASLGPAVDVLLAHLGLLYLLAVFALMRRQGPAWREAPPAAGSAGAFLLGLGTLHDRLGHHAAAASMLLARARELDRDLALPAGFERRAAAAGREELLALAREVAHLRRHRSARRTAAPPGAAPSPRPPAMS